MAPQCLSAPGDSFLCNTYIAYNTYNIYNAYNAYNTCNTGNAYNTCSAYNTYANTFFPAQTNFDSLKVLPIVMP